MNESYETNQGYNIMRGETFATDSDSTEHRIVLGSMMTSNGPAYVTWESTRRKFPASDTGEEAVSYFWGHYFLNDHDAAVRDYHLRLAEEYERS